MLRAPQRPIPFLKETPGIASGISLHAETPTRRNGLRRPPQLSMLSPKGRGEGATSQSSGGRAHSLTVCGALPGPHSMDPSSSLVAENASIKLTHYRQRHA